jgi:hypothetical protein
MHSSIEKILITAKRLPDPLKVIFQGMFFENKSDEEIRISQGLSVEEFKECQSQMLREIRSLAHPV